jgi:hypothetical protein
LLASNLEQLPANVCGIANSSFDRGHYLLWREAGSSSVGNIMREGKPLWPTSEMKGDIWPKSTNNALSAAEALLSYAVKALNTRDGVAGGSKHSGKRRPRQAK